MTPIRSLALAGALIFGSAEAEAQSFNDHFALNCSADVMTIWGVPRVVLWGYNPQGFSWYPDFNSAIPWPGVQLYPRRCFIYSDLPCSVGQWWGFRITPGGNPDPLYMQEITQVGWSGDPSTFYDPIAPLVPGQNSGFASSSMDELIYEAVVQNQIPWYMPNPQPCGYEPSVTWVVICDVALY